MTCHLLGVHHSAMPLASSFPQWRVTVLVLDEGENGKKPF